MVVPFVTNNHCVKSCFAKNCAALIYFVATTGMTRMRAKPSHRVRMFQNIAQETIGGMS